MKRFYIILIVSLILSFKVHGQLDVPDVYNAGPLGEGAWLRFMPNNSTSIQQRWGINISGSAQQPVKIYNASLLVGYQSDGANHGINNLLVNGKIGVGTINPQGVLDINFSNNEPKGFRIFSETNNNGYSGIGGMRFSWFNTNFADIQIVRGMSSDDGAGIAFHTSTSNNSLTSERMRINQNGNVGVGITDPLAKLHVSGGGVSKDIGDTKSVSGDFIVQGNTGSRNTTTGAQLEFVIPANTGGDNYWGQGRIITVAGNTNNFDASGKMILGTRRHFNKVGAGNQWYYGDDLVIDPNGNLGVGTINPSSKLTVNPGGPGGILVGDYTQGNTYVTMHISGSQNGHAVLQSVKNAGNEYGTLSLNRDGGNVGIGTASPDARLTVKGTIHANEVRVDNSVPAPDYVFKKNYDLKSLSEVETYIRANSHLPELPSAKEIEENGIKLSEMSMLLLKKVEELTLHLIEKDKQIVKLKSETKEQKCLILEQEKYLIQIDKKLRQILSKSHY